MKSNLRLVADVKVFVSYLLFNDSTPGKAIARGFRKGNFLLSEEVVHELINVLTRKKFDTYLPVYERILFLDRLMNKSIYIVPNIQITACTDPKDNKYLELAASGKADCIISGDKRHLLVMKSYEKIPILSPREFLEFDI